MTYGASGVLVLVIVLWIIMAIAGARNTLLEKLLLIVGVVAAIVLILDLLGVSFHA